MNKTYDVRLLERDANFHRKNMVHARRLRAIRCRKMGSGTLDNLPPRTLSTAIRSAKKKQMQKQMRKKIARDNKALQQRLRGIKSAAPPPPLSSGPISLNLSRRRKEDSRIRKENVMIFNRLVKCKPKYDSKAWKKEMENHNRFVRNMSAYTHSEAKRKARERALRYSRESRSPRSSAKPTAPRSASRPSKPSPRSNRFRCRPQTAPPKFRDAPKSLGSTPFRRKRRRRKRKGGKRAERSEKASAAAWDSMSEKEKSAANPYRHFLEREKKRVQETLAEAEKRLASETISSVLELAVKR